MLKQLTVTVSRFYGVRLRALTAVGLMVAARFEILVVVGQKQLIINSGWSRTRVGMTHQL